MFDMQKGNCENEETNKQVREQNGGDSAVTQKGSSAEYSHSLVEEIHDKVRGLNFGDSDYKDNENSYHGDEFGILSELKRLKFDESSVSDSSPYNFLSKARSPFTPIKDGVGNWKVEEKNEKIEKNEKEKMNPKFYPVSKVSSESIANTPENCLNFSTFSTYLENNPMLRYFDKRVDKGGETPKMEISTLARPNYFIKQNENETTFNNSNQPIITHCEKVNNAFINMNVNMNVLNNNPPMKETLVRNNQLNFEDKYNIETVSKEIRNNNYNHNVRNLQANQNNNVTYNQFEWNYPNHCGFVAPNLYGGNSNTYNKPTNLKKRDSILSTYGDNGQVTNNNFNMNANNFIFNTSLNCEQVFINNSNSSNRREEGNIRGRNRVSAPNFMVMNDEELARNAFFLAKDQAGCRFLQKKIEDHSEMANVIYPKLIENLIELMNDAFGNYLIQKLFQYISSDKLFQILAIINPHLTQLGINPHGTRVIQRLIDYLTTDDLLNSFITILKPHVIFLLKDINGNHVVQKLINSLDEKYTHFIYDIIFDNVVDISTHKHGCCVLQKCIDISKGASRDRLIEVIIDYTPHLIFDQFGNYIVQYILNLNNLEINRKIISSLLPNICHLSKQKYSSNVVEKCFNYSDEKCKDDLIKSLLNAEVITELILDMYGNYVVQKALQCAKPDDQHFILMTIAPVMEKLRFYNFGTKLYNKLIIKYPQLPSLMFLVNNNEPSQDNFNAGQNYQMNFCNNSMQNHDSNQYYNNFTYALNNNQNCLQNHNYNRQNYKKNFHKHKLN